MVATRISAIINPIGKAGMSISEEICPSLAVMVSFAVAFDMAEQKR